MVYQSGNNIAETTRLLQDDLLKLCSWFECNKLTVNIKKTKYVIWLRSQTRRTKNHSLLFDNRRIERVSTYKHLGITVGIHLTFNKHIDNCHRLAAHKIYLLSTIRKYINFQASQSIYKTTILPYLDYGEIIYGGTNQKALRKLQTLQNQGLRICVNERGHISTID